jgi:hypothetical protein
MAFAPVFSLKRGHRTPDGGTVSGTYLRTGWILRRAAQSQVIILGKVGDPTYKTEWLPMLDR